VALVVPHIFIDRDILPKVIFSPGHLALDLARALPSQGIDITLFTPGAADTDLPNETADLSGFQRELDARGYGYIELLRKHPLVFVSLARQVQAELIAKVFQMANRGDFDVVHIFTNEEDIALHFARFCRVPVLFTHHDPYNFLIKYKAVFPKYRQLNYISLSLAQRRTMPPDTNWRANIYHGLDPTTIQPNFQPGNYLAYLGRIIQPKGVALAIDAVEKYNRAHPGGQLKLKIAGLHYDNDGKDDYWQTQIAPHLGRQIEYVGFLAGQKKAEFLRGARALLVPSLFDEPFGVVSIEALAAGTPIIGSLSGATPEIALDGRTGFIAEPANFADYFDKIDQIDRRACRADFEKRFTLERMARDHAELYRRAAAEHWPNLS
jgi:glycosyltransferase involved in cell wall biosynthesis